jgi:hypothetical protein
MATDMHATTEEPLEAMFSMRFMPRLYSEDKWEKLVSHGSGVRSQRLELAVTSLES